MPRLNRGGRRWAVPVRAGVARGESVRILGLDPGSQATGFGVIDWVEGEARYVASGAIRTAGSEFPPRLRQIFDGVAALMREYAPREVAIERVFLHRNADSALKLGQARGAAISAVVLRDLPVSEYAAREVKLAVVGTGSADKAQIQHMVMAMLGLAGKIEADAADALAIAICHAHHRALKARLSA